MNRDEIRFRLLTLLYEKYYQYEKRPLSAQNILIELKPEKDESTIFSEMNYLHHNGLAWGQEILDEKYLSQIRITQNGLDLVERVINQSLDETQDEALKEKLRHILNDPNPTLKIRRFLDLTKSYSTLLGLVVSVFRKLLKEED